METKPDYATILDRQVREQLGGLLKRGYVYQGVSHEQTSAIGEFDEAVFINKNINRTVKVRYLPPVPEGVAVLSVHIEHAGRDTFSTTEYLKHIGAPPELADKLRLKNYSGPLEERIRACLMAFTSIMEEYFGRILDGKEWTHVPIDWQGHK